MLFDKMILLLTCNKKQEKKAKRNFKKKRKVEPEGRRRDLRRNATLRAKKDLLGLGLKREMGLL